MLKIRCITIKKAAKGSLSKGKASCLYLTGGSKACLQTHLKIFLFPNDLSQQTNEVRGCLVRKDNMCRKNILDPEL